MTATAVAEPVARRGGVKAFLKLVVIEHSVFALPFAYVSALTAMTVVAVREGGGPLRAASGGDVGWRDLVAITVAMVAARTFAMAANRLIDRELDARNPRTATRELVTGAVSLRTVRIGMAVSLAVFLAAALYLAPICLALAPVAVAPLVLYPYAKRFTWLCHYVLGFAQAIAPVGAWVAVADGFGRTPIAESVDGLTGSYSAPFLSAILLGLAVGTWIAGFDLIYACQDVESDRREGVHSLPARFGVRTALRVSEVTHLVTVALLVAFGAVAGYGVIWFAAVALTAAALVYEHAIVRPDDLSRVNRAFFTVNGWIGIGLLAFAVADLVARGFRP
ncbi:MAG TPA: 4-hydroxybenzoate octaprenyltransferase [Frankiaceae bacterium]|nr:4-hydroxybenzoate octaprenyltransferase [Frankiaceae bacterium]